MSDNLTTLRKLDPVTFEVLRRGFDYACERMSQVLQKASFSPIIYDMVDFSSAVFDPDVELIGQTANCPVHIAAMHYSARASLAKFPRETLKDGDVVILNDPYLGGTHTPDVTLTTPIYTMTNSLPTPSAGPTGPTLASRWTLTSRAKASVSLH